MIIHCPNCKTKNRIPAAKLHLQGKCGQCKNAIGPINYPIDVDASGFQEIINQASVPVLVDFWAPWCGPCKSVAPQVDKAAQSLAGEVITIKLNTEAQAAIAQRCRIQSIPTFALFKNGKEIKRQAGGAPANQLVQFAKH